MINTTEKCTKTHQFKSNIKIFGMGSASSALQWWK